MSTPPLRLFQYSYLQHGEHVLDFMKDRLYVLNKFSIWM